MFSMRHHDRETRSRDEAQERVSGTVDDVRWGATRPERL
jgi:hypothetical protein